MSYKLRSPVQFILIILVILSFSLLTFITFFDGEVTSKVDCYDRFSNKIIGESCEEIEFENQDILRGSMAVCFISMMIWAYVVITRPWNYPVEINLFGFEKQGSTETK